MLNQVVLLPLPFFFCFGLYSLFMKVANLQVNILNSTFLTTMSQGLNFRYKILVYHICYVMLCGIASVFRKVSWCSCAFSCAPRCANGMKMMTKAVSCIADTIIIKVEKHSPHFFVRSYLTSFQSQSYTWCKRALYMPVASLLLVPEAATDNFECVPHLPLWVSAALAHFQGYVTWACKVFPFVRKIPQ